jgi:starch-binding outer membrane protein, SusD/RagB family
MKLKIIQRVIRQLVAAVVLINLFSCKKFVMVDPPITSISAYTVYATDDMAASVLTNLYAKMSQAGLTSNSSINVSFYAGLSSDELTLYSGSGNTTHIAYYKNALITNPALITDFWKNFYPIVFAANTAIEEIEKSQTLTLSVKNQLLGEAKFLRAFCYFYLVNLYGDVVLITGTDYEINRLLPRTPKTKVWEQIVNDLKEAKSLMGSNYLKADIINVTTDRARPTKWAATALLSRAYLYTNKYDSAEMQASEVINNTSLYDTVSLNNVFLKNSKEAIWQLQPVNTGWNTEDARVFVLPSAPNLIRPVYLSTTLLNAFELDDLRKTSWVKSITAGSTTYFFPYKYKVATQNASVTEYQMVLRLGEQYLIRAEARAQMNKIPESQADLNLVRRRAGLLPTTATTQSSLLSAILHERQVELFTEWGHRWFDLKRTGTVDGVMSNVTTTKGGTWETTDQLYPLPLADIQRNPNLTQNSGY